MPIPFAPRARRRHLLQPEWCKPKAHVAECTECAEDAESRVCDLIATGASIGGWEAMTVHLQDIPTLVRTPLGSRHTDLPLFPIANWGHDGEAEADPQDRQQGPKQRSRPCIEGQLKARK